MKKFFSSIICFCLLLVSAFTFAACGNEKVSIDDASDSIEEVQSETTAFSMLLSDEADSDVRSAQEKGIIRAVGQGINTVSTMVSALVMLDMFNDGEYDPADFGGVTISKKGSTYTLTIDGNPITYKVTSDKNSITLSSDSDSLKVTLAKNYIRIDATNTYGQTTSNAYAELKEVGNNHYYQLVSVKEDSYDVVYAKYNFTTTETNDVETSTINSFSILAKESVATKPASIKNVKDFSAFAAGEGSVSYTATPAQ